MGKTPLNPSNFQDDSASAVASVQLNPKSFQDTPLADLCFEDALKAGARRSEYLKDSDFRETSLRFCINGLRNWLNRYSKDYADQSLFRIIQNASWHWASYCSTNANFVNICSEYRSLSKEIVETTSYTDLVERLQQPSWLEKFGHRSNTPCNVLLPLEASGIISDVGEAIGIPFSKFFQVGLAWSLSTNKQGLYTEWIKDIFTPLFDEVMAITEKRIIVLEEVRGTFEQRIVRRLRAEASEADNTSP